ncbi:MAG: MFS transporter [Phycisphaerales bacterium]|nr:MFS transporter [Phycisphaerales bacterium]
MAHATTPERRGRVGGWFQAGNLGGNGLGGGAGLWIATNLPTAAAPQPWLSGAALGVLFLIGAGALLFVPEVKAESRARSLPSAIGGVAVEMWTMIKSKAGLLCALLCLLPMNSGTATGVLSQAEVAAKWGANEDTVALVNGALNGIVSAIGCLVAGEICARMSSRKVYAIVGVLLAGVSVAMALSPFTKVNYVSFSLVYVFVVGLSYTAFTGFVLDTIGKGAAATKYNAFASLSNAPITYMGLVLAWAQTKWGEEGMLYTDAAAGVVGLMVLGVAAMIIGPIAKPASANGTAGAEGAAG